jgi:hypothetical protein
LEIIGINIEVELYRRKQVQFELIEFPRGYSASDGEGLIVKVEVVVVFRGGQDSYQ